MQDGDAVVDEAVVDALAQVDAAGGGQGFVVGLVGGGDVVEGGDSGVTGGANCFDMGGREGFGAAGREGEDEGEAGQAAPLVAEVVFVEAEADVGRRKRAKSPMGRAASQRLSMAGRSGPKVTNSGSMLNHWAQRTRMRVTEVRELESRAMWSGWR